jgi:hypothetical protein
MDSYFYYLTTDFSQSYTEILNCLRRKSKNYFYLYFFSRDFPCPSVVNISSLTPFKPLKGSRLNPNFQAPKHKWFDKPFDRLTVLSKVERLTTLIQIER